MKIEDMKRGMTFEQFRGHAGPTKRLRLCLFLERKIDYAGGTSDDERMRAEMVRDIFQDVREELDRLIKDEDLRSCIEDSRRRHLGDAFIRKLKVLRSHIS